MCGCGCPRGFPRKHSKYYSDVQICSNDLIFGNLSYLFFFFKEMPSIQESLFDFFFYVVMSKINMGGGFDLQSIRLFFFSDILSYII